MKLTEAVPNWNRLAGATPRSHNSSAFTVKLTLHPDATSEDASGEIQELQDRIQYLVEEAMSDGTTLITNVDFE